MRRENHKSRLIIVFCVIIVIVIVGSVLWSNVTHSNFNPVRSTKLSCPVHMEMKQMGSNLVYYDGMDFNCIDADGAERWRYTIGENASFDTANNCVVGWSGTQLLIINESGKSTYYNNMGTNIQFAAASEESVAVVLGENSPANEQTTIMVINHEGKELEKPTEGFEDRLILDAGFFGDDHYMWYTSLGLYGVAPTIYLKTNQVGGNELGSQSMGESTVYEVLSKGNTLYTVDTRNLRKFDYRGIEDAEAEKITYGWELIAHSNKTQEIGMLFAPVAQNAGMEAFTDLMYLSGDTQKRFILPEECVGATLVGDCIYAFASNKIYRVFVDDTYFVGVETKMSQGIKDFHGLLGSKVALLSTNDALFAVTLP